MIEIRKAEAEDREAVARPVSYTHLDVYKRQVLSIKTTRNLERRRVHDVADREKMFDLLSTNVDDVFFIYSLKDKLMEYILSLIHI